jgi:Holliday junction resolvase
MELNLFTITEVLKEIDPSISPQEAFNRIKQIDYGLSAEDEFLAIITWLGRCRLCHKNENVVFSSFSREKQVIPDLIAVFEFKKSVLPVAIEVKSTKTNQLNWTDSYYKSLLSYQINIGIPVLVAWKHSDINIWTLNSLQSFSKAKTNYHLSFEKAFQDNLLSCIAGDIAYQLCDGVGLHLVYSKEELISKDEDDKGETWNVVIKDAFFTDGNGKHYSTLPEGVWPLFIACDQYNDSEVGGNEIFQKYIIDSTKPGINSFQYLHIALSQLIRFFQNDSTIKWRQKLRDNSLPVSSEHLKKALSTSFGVFARYVFHFLPKTIPEFLKDTSYIQEEEKPTA